MSFNSTIEGKPIAKRKKSMLGLGPDWSLPPSLPLSRRNEEGFDHLNSIVALANIQPAFDSPVGDDDRFSQMRGDDIFKSGDANTSSSSFGRRRHYLSFGFSDCTRLSRLLASLGDGRGMKGFHTLASDDETIRDPLSSPVDPPLTSAVLSTGEHGVVYADPGFDIHGDGPIVVDSEIDDQPVELIIDNHATVSTLSKALIDQLGLGDEIYESETPQHQGALVVYIETLRVMGKPAPAVEFQICDDCKTIDGRIGRALRETIDLHFVR
ncbi:MAG: hypothetical protein VYA30_09825 [Myxococcota bacterium]|nr:hypothetical protein [Myxococcota bacterium]